MENSPQPESIPQKLETGFDAMLEMNRRHVIESIKKNGLDESMEIVSSWCAKAERWAEEDPLNRTKVTRRMVIVNFGKYDFYVAAEDMAGANECAEDALYMAEQEGHDDLIEIIKKKSI